MMRVTNSMMIHNMVYWTAKQLDKLNDASTVVASGKQINKPSDDPTAVRQIQADKTTISSYTQYEYNLELAQIWINISDTTLTSVYSLLQEAEEAVSSSTSSNSDIALGVEGIYKQVFVMANSYYSTAYMYSGNLSDTQPFADEVNISGGAPANIIFDLAAADANMTIVITDSNGDVVRTLTATAGLAGTNSIAWDGLDDSGTALADGDYAFTVSATDASGGAVASYPTYRGDTGGKEFIIGTDASIILNNNGGEIFSPSLKVLSQIITALRDSSTTDSSTADLSTTIQEALSQIETQEVALANASSLATNAADRLDKLTTYLANRISDIETGSVEEAAVKLTAQKTAHDVTISTSASILNMAKLSDYL
jgi:flagellin-like hook-associated protein FlgL